jgi:hypothetical protein
MLPEAAPRAVTPAMKMYSSGPPWVLALDGARGMGGGYRERRVRAALTQVAKIHRAARPLMPNGKAGLTRIPTRLRPTMTANGPTVAKTGIESSANRHTHRERQT